MSFAQSADTATLKVSVSPTKAGTEKKPKSVEYTLNIVNGNTKPMLGFFIDDGASLQFLTETTLTKASGKYGQRLHIDVPELAQRAGTTYNGLSRSAPR